MLLAGEIIKMFLHEFPKHTDVARANVTIRVTLRVINPAWYKLGQWMQFPIECMGQMGTFELVGLFFKNLANFKQQISL